MLTHLTISNYALVRQLDLDFSSAMTVVTGETGAGKSIMLDALGLTLGDRADARLIAAGSDRAEISSVFDVSRIPDAMDWLDRRDLDNQEDTVILRRVLTRDGKSRGFINGTPATLSDMRHLGSFLVDLHSQHEHQSLLKKATHRRLLDEFAGHSGKIRELENCCMQFRETRTSLDRLVTDTREQSARLQLLSYQAEELQRLDVSPGEPGRLEAELKHLAGAEARLLKCREVLSLCDPASETGVTAPLGRAVSLLDAIEDPEVDAVREMMASGLIQIEEASRDLEHLMQRYEIDPGRLAEVEKRLDEIYTIARKHRIDPEDLPDLKDSIDRELQSLTSADESMEALSARLEEIRRDYDRLAADIGTGRREAATVLQSRVSDKLAELGMTGACFEVTLQSGTGEDPSPHGNEDVEFLISSNPGQPPGALARIASGGELSRISLAIQVVTANTSNIPTLIFDEVDTGIGGAVAEVVGAMLRELGNHAQIICVTHLAQVASQGHHHLLVRRAGNGRSDTSVETLGDQEKIEEIARMLGGVELTEQSRAHAREMYSTAQK